MFSKFKMFSVPVEVILILMFYNFVKIIYHIVTVNFTNDCSCTIFTEMVILNGLRFQTFKQIILFYK